MSSNQEIDTLISAKREWDSIEQSLSDLRATGAIYAGQNLNAKFKAQLIVAVRQGETVLSAIGRLRPDLIASRSAPAGKSGCVGVLCFAFLLASLACLAMLYR